MPIAYVGLGSNIGDRRDNISQAIDLLAETDGIALVNISALYETEPEGYDDQDWFINAVAELDTPISPYELLRLFKSIEQKIGRRKSIRWGPREIDLDLLLYDKLHIATSELTVPHPRMHERAFVLVPMAEIAADMLHPVLNKTISTLLKELKNPKSVKRII